MKIYCANIHRYVSITGGQTLLSIAAGLGDQLGFRPLCALVNNRTEDLGFAVYMPKQVEYLDLRHPAARRVYIRSLCMLLYKAVTTTLPGLRLRIEHSISRGLYCTLRDEADNHWIPDQSALDSLVGTMRTLITADLPFEHHERLTSDVTEIFRSQGLTDKVTLLETGHELYTSYYVLDGLADSYYGPLAPSTGYLDVFGLHTYKEGMLLLGPGADTPQVTATPLTQEKMFEAFKEYQRFNAVIRVSNVGELNRVVEQHRTAELINVAETMHSKLIGRISDEIADRHSRGGARVVFIAGPSSSGKTTTAKRLGYQLMTSLLQPRVISMDDYFVDRDATPLGPDGNPDFEALHALDLDRFSADLQALLAGKTINLPTYSFELGRRIEKHRPLSLAPDEVLVIEGIHGLNPELSAALPSSEIYKIYVSALTTLSIDDHNWIPTTDNRLLRRIVRDYKYRHSSALQTIRMWRSVRKGEQRWIFPYQENADATFNSSLIFELGVMRDYATPILRQVPHDCPEYAEAYRLLKFLSYFAPIGAEQVPSTSLLREFLGGSAFNY